MNYNDGDWNIKKYLVDPMHAAHQAYFDANSEAEKNKVVNLKDYEHLRGKVVDRFFYTELRKWKQEQERKRLVRIQNAIVTKRLQRALLGKKNPADL